MSANLRRRLDRLTATTAPAADPVALADRLAALAAAYDALPEAERAAAYARWDAQLEARCPGLGDRLRARCAEVTP